MRKQTAFIHGHIAHNYNRPISYGSQRRTGLMGAHVVKLDPEQKKLSPTGAWVRLD